MRSICITMFLLALTGCAGEDTPVTTAESAAPASDAAGPISAQAMAQWARNCALCHVRGEGGAPVLGDADAWAPRIAQGDEVLLIHTVEGLNNMPPLGYCMDCEEEDFRQIIAFLSGRGEGGDQ